MYKKILVGVDGSLHGAKALETAVKLAQTFKAELFVFHAIRHHYHLPLFPIAPYTFSQATLTPYDYSDEALQQMYEESGRQIIEEAKNQFKAMNVTLESKVTFNLETMIPPAEYAEDFAKANKIDLIVLGCFGHHSRAKKIFMGTVATRIMNNAPCPVLIVR